MKVKNIVLVIISLIMCVGLFAQTAAETAATAAPKSQGYSITQVFVDSGRWAYAILLVLVIGVVYAIVRWNQLYRKEKIDAGGFYLKLRNYIKNDQLEEATKIAESYK